MTPQDRFQSAPDYHSGLGSLRAQNVGFAWGIIMPVQKSQSDQILAPVGVTLGKGEVVSSILTRGTSRKSLSLNGNAQPNGGDFPSETLQKFAKLCANTTRLPWSSRGVRSQRVGVMFTAPDPSAGLALFKFGNGREIAGATNK